MEAKKNADDASLDMSKRLVQIDLAIYDETQWQKIMEDVEKSKQVMEAVKQPENKELNAKVDKMEPLMTCEERLAHAIEIDKIKIYPNYSMVIEKTKRRYLGNSRDSQDNGEEQFRNTDTF